MSRKTLIARLNDAAGVLDKVNNALNRHAAKLPPELLLTFQEFLQCKNDFSHWKSLIEAREASGRLLAGLESRVDGSDRVDVGGQLMEFNIVRLFLTQAYLSSAWSLADHVMAACGKVLLPPSASMDPKRPAQILDLFSSDRKKLCPGVIFKSFKKSFGWAIGISYASRNLFLHDGGRLTSGNFFLGPTSSDAFRISQDGWDFLVARARTYNVDETDTIPVWPMSPHDDLRTIHDLCAGEVDCALGIILGSACGALLSHVTFLVEED